jgi:hypothetical protein
MENQIEVRIEVSAASVMEVYFWQNGWRSESLHLYGPEDEYLIEGNPISESCCAWVTLMIQRKETGRNKIVWEVVYKTNAVDNDLHTALEGVMRKIETVIEKGAQARIVLDEDLKLSEWEAVLPQAAVSST